jgi:CPA1 family monovalent cation:H+ antiporter
VQLDSAIVTAVLSVMGLLFLATILSVVTSKLKLPFSLTLVAVGVALGLAVRFVPPLEPVASLRLSSELLTYILLPTLVFHAAYAIDSRLLGQNLLPVLVLAVPALVVSFLVASFGVHWAVGIPLGAALLFGALISSTDSGAVLAVFHNLGAPKRLTVLVEGESLFNDAASIVIFQLVMAGVGLGVATQSLEGNLIWAGSVAFTVNFAGGLLFGAAIGHLAGHVIEVIENDDLVEILLTTTVAYLSFIVAELVFHVSGVMAVVGTGLVLGGAGITKYSPPTLEYLDRFWQYLAFIANSLIFLLIGLHVAIEIDVMRGLIVPIGFAIVISVVARAVGVFSLFPIVNRLPNIEKVDARYQIAIAWGGLRGAVALVLAMSLPADFQYRSEIIGLAFGVVLFSLLVQGLSLEPLIRFLGLQRASVPEMFARDDSLLAAKNRARARISELRAAGMFSEKVTSELDRSYGDQEQQIRERIEQLRERGFLGSREEFRLLRREYLLVEKRVYQDLFHRGQVSEKVLRGLQHSIELQMDHLRYGGVLPAWTIHSPAHWKLEAGLFRVLEALFPWGNVVQHYRLNRIADLYEQHWGRLVASQRVLEELRRIEDRGSGQPELVSELIDLYTVWNENARKRLDAVGEQYPEYATKVQQIMATRLCLQAEDEVISDLERLDVLPEREAKQMRAEVQAKLKRLRQKPLEELRPRPRELLSKVPFFRSLPSEEFDQVLERLRARTFLADEVIVREGDLGQSMFLIGRGVVRVSIGGGGIESIPLATLLAGEFFGEMAVLSGNPRNATVTAVTHCTLYELTRADLFAVQDMCPTIQQALEAAVAERRLGNASARLAKSARAFSG